MLFGVSNYPGEPYLIEGLQEIAEGVDFECLNRILVVRGYEDDAWNGIWLRQPFDNGLIVSRKERA